MRYKHLKYRHQIVKALYDKFEKDDHLSNHAYHLSLSMRQLIQKTGIKEDTLLRELKFLEMEGVLTFYGRKQNVSEEKWFLMNHNVYLDSIYLEERKVKIFDSYKRLFSYIGIPLGLILALISIVNKIQTSSNSDRIDKIEKVISKE